MKISEVSAQSGARVSAVKFYIREHLVPEGERRGPNQTEYGESHVQRVRLVRALIETGGLSISAVRDVLAVLDANESLAYTFEAAQRAMNAPETKNGASASARQRVSDLLHGSGWHSTADNPGLELAARALDGLSTIGFEPSESYLLAYADAASIVARADLAALGTRTQPELVAELMVVGTVMGDALSAGLRRLAQQHETATAFPVADDREGNDGA